jgi:hypothetical protein
VTAMPRRPVRVFVSSIQERNRDPGLAHLTGLCPLHVRQAHPVSLAPRIMIPCIDFPQLPYPDARGAIASHQPETL